jgi:hypothetical protein
MALRLVGADAADVVDVAHRVHRAIAGTAR